MTAPVVEGSGLSVTYGQRGHVHHAVVDLTVAVHPGEIVGVTGASGCGKSTTLRLLAGLEQPHAGTVRLGGADIWAEGRTPRPPRPGYVMPVFQDPVASLDRRWPIWRSVTEPLTVGRPRMSKQERMAAAREHLARLSLDHLDVRCLPTQLSGGQCQRVAIARALVAGPALVVADEPTASLDVTTAAGVTRVLREAADQGTALVIVSHDQDRLSVLADRILRMNRGRVVAEEVLRPLVHARRGTDE
ncbi:dipeptide/oligopeptide/nickel ABC transporter ATP-binding protein [Jiangella alba]|uniref:ABC transporter n=1 Tax=Jiangella alba TaxID=561176 RepID=A0A1H5PZ30_9ACTN|nr:dipeptide/oligopeptide/nickel ABC transporter ATP-binding protein [Jiangella alba]SEF18959.1 ABC transporter [Jiangella alba]